MIPRRTFLAALSAVPLARLLPDLQASPFAETGGPFPFAITFPDGETLHFSGMVRDAQGGPVDLRTLTGVQDISIAPVGALRVTIGQAPSEVEEITELDDKPDQECGGQLTLDGVAIADIADITAPEPPDESEFLLSSAPFSLTVNFRSGADA